MIMTAKLATELMNNLACLALSATGGVVTDENGEFNQEQLDYAQEYARKTFCELADAWEELLGKKWQIEIEKESNKDSIPQKPLITLTQAYNRVIICIERMNKVTSTSGRKYNWDEIKRYIKMYPELEKFFCIDWTGKYCDSIKQIKWLY